MLVALAQDGAGVLAAAPVDATLRADPSAAGRARLDRRGRAGRRAGRDLRRAAARPAAGPAAEGAGDLPAATSSCASSRPRTRSSRALAFDERVEGADRLRARALVVPAAVLADAGDLRDPIGASHPLRVAEAVARLGGDPADPEATEALEDLLPPCSGPSGEHARPHEDPDPARRVARRILQRLAGMGKWGGYHTEFAHLPRGFAGNDRALAMEVGEALLAAGLLLEKPSVGQRHVYLNPRRARTSTRFVDEGDAPAGLSLPRAEDDNMPSLSLPAPVSAAFLARTLVERRRAGAERPDRLLAAGHALLRFGLTPAAGYTAAAARYPDEVGDHRRQRHADLQRGPRALQRARPRARRRRRQRGRRRGDHGRNHRGFVEAVVACSKLGANALFLNTSFSGPQLADVSSARSRGALIYDEEFADVLREAGRAAQALRRLARAGRAAARTRRSTSSSTRGDPPTSSRPPSEGKAIILTSGTTGTPKGASRAQPKSLDPVAALLDRIPLHARERTMIAAPLFHAWGFAHCMLGLGLTRPSCSSAASTPRRRCR